MKIAISYSYFSHSGHPDISYSSSIAEIVEVIQLKKDRTAKGSHRSTFQAGS